MNKPIYSKRRLKNMGINLHVTEKDIAINIKSNGGLCKHVRNVLKMVKDVEKPISVSMAGHSLSAAGFINSFKI